MSTDIVVGIDGSANATKALHWAVEEAKIRGVRVRAVLTWSFMGQGSSVLGVGTTEADAQKALQAVIDNEANDDTEIIDAVTVNDLPIDGLLDQAKDAALLVVGSRGIGGVKGLVLGSTSKKIGERSPIPVVIVPLHD